MPDPEEIMLKRALVVGYAGLVLLTASPVSAQGVAIDHSAVGCLVAEKFPKLSACFTPSDQLARARVYFRAEGGPYWYFVDMKLETAEAVSGGATPAATTVTKGGAPCYIGVLPKPKKTIQKMNYYVEAVDKGFAEARTAEYAPVVVPDAGGCKKDVPAAPFLQNASVTVGAAAGAPVVPAGFAAAGVVGAAGGASAVVVGAVVAGAGAATAGIVAATGGSSSSGSPTTTTTLSTATSTTLPATLPTPPPTTQPPVNSVNRPPNAVFVVTPDPPTGPAPLAVKFDMCGSKDPDGDPLTFKYNFGDGQTGSGGCRTTHIYQNPTLSAQSVNGTVTAVLSVSDDHGHTVSNSYSVEADCGLPQVTITSPANNSNINATSVNIDVSATDPLGIRVVKFYDANVGKPSGPASFGNLFATDTTAPYSAVFRGNCCCWVVTAQAINSCGGIATATVNFNLQCAGIASASTLSWTSDLAMEGARGQLAVNGQMRMASGEGRTFSRADARPGENRVEGTIVAATGKPGTWRFELTADESVAPGTLRAVTGKVVEISDHLIVFQLTGQAGERIAFTLRSR
jgi:hypothetical protein